MILSPRVQALKRSAPRPDPIVKADSMSKEGGKWVKWAVLLVLVLQNSAQSILMKYSRQAQETYISSTAVLCCETLKLIASVLMFWRVSICQHLHLTPALTALLYVFRSSVLASTNCTCA
jgi:hypothetical protein